MQIQMSPLQLDGYYLKAISVAVRDEAEAFEQYVFRPPFTMAFSEIPFAPNLSLTVNGQFAPNMEDKTRFKGTMIVESSITPETPFPCEFRVEIVGFFVLMDPEKKFEPGPETLANIHRGCLSLLYPIARDLLTTITARHPFPPVVIPAVLFVNEPEDVERYKAAVMGSEPKRRVGTKRRIVKSKRIPGRKRTAVKVRA